MSLKCIIFCLIYVGIILFAIALCSMGSPMSKEEQDIEDKEQQNYINKWIKGRKEYDA